jgi:hypothetical protein
MPDYRPILEESFDEPSGVGRVMVPRPEALRDALGAPALAGLARLCISADRLTSLFVMLKLNTEHFQQESSIGAERNRMNLFLLSCGVSFELAGDILDLHKLGFASRLSPKGFAAWRDLRKMAAKWLHDPFFQQIRNKAAFHTDHDALVLGLDALIADGEPFILTEGTSPEFRASRYSFSLGALLRGLWPEHFPVRPRDASLPSPGSESDVASSVVAVVPPLKRRFSEISADQASVIQLLPVVIQELCQELKRPNHPGTTPPSATQAE